MQFMEFEYNLPVHIVFGRGCIEQLGSEAAKLGKRALLVTGRSSTKKSGLFGPRRRTAERRRRGKRRI